uniref:Uncharacterized protein n=1 Tax=Oryza nivara TaxID=4536 RepID=A0A0E0HVV7_ORYNI
MVKKKPAGDAEADERRRLRSLAFSNGLLQRGEPAAPRSALAPSTAVSRLQGRDIVRRGGQRKSRFLFSFPGLLAPAAAASGGRVGELILAPKILCSTSTSHRSGEDEAVGDACVPQEQVSDTADDVFESLIVFSEAWWIGTKEEENPQELKLDFPKEFQNDEAVADSDFKGGAGASCDEAVSINKPPKEPPQDPFPLRLNLTLILPRIQTLRTRITHKALVKHLQLKALKYTEISSGDDSSDNDDEIDVPEDMDEKMKSPAVKNESQSEDIKPADSSAQPISAKKEPLVQATLSSMFKKAEEKKGPAAKKQRASPEEKHPTGKKSAGRSQKRRKTQVEDDEIEVLSSSSQVVPSSQLILTAYDRITTWTMIAMRTGLSDVQLKLKGM